VVSSSANSGAFSSLRRLFAAKALVIAEHNGSAPNGATLSAITAAAQLSKDSKVTVLFAGSTADNAAKVGSSLNGVSNVLVAKNAGFDNPIAEKYAPLIASLQKEHNFTHIVAPSTTFGKNILPRVAATLDVSPITDVVAIQEENTFKKPIYAGNAIATVKSNDPVKLLTVRGTAFAKAAAGGSSAPVSEVSTAPVQDDRVQYLGSEIAKSDRPELTAASIVVSGGRALKSKENFKIIETLADAFGAAGLCCFFSFVGGVSLKGLDQ